VHNYGIAIILLTLLLKLILLPLTLRGDAKLKQQQELAHKLSYAKQHYANDPERLAREQASLIRKYGFPGAGCLPLLLQIPIFIAIRGVLSNAVELYQAPFLWIPDLSVRDPYYILPLVLVIAMFVQAAYAEKSQKPTIIAMGLVFGAVMAQFAAGLVLYFVMHSALTVLQTRIMKYMKWA
jgi:YidC/Oxa1 family membrane protein insertase